MRIAIVGTRGVPARYGGFETYAEELGSRLVRMGHEVLVTCRPHLYPDRRSAYLGMSLVYPPSIPGKATDTLSHTLFSVRAVLAWRPDAVLLCNVANSPVGLVLSIFGVPVVINVDGLEWKRKKWGPAGRFYFRCAEAVACAGARALISDSRAIRDYYLHRFRRDSAFIPYGARQVCPLRPGLLERFGLRPGEYFFTASRIEPENHQDCAVEAFLSLDTDKCFALAGAPNPNSSYARKLCAVKDPRVRFLGAVYERDIVDELFSNAYAYIHGNEVGGTNPALLQAMGAGCAVLALDVVFNREVLGDAGVYFRLDAGDLRRAMAWMLQHPDRAQAFRDAARQRARLLYDWNRVAEDTERLLRSIVAGRSA